MQQSRFWTFNNGFGIGMRFIVNGQRIDSEGRTTSVLVARFRFGVEHSLDEADHSFSESHTHTIRRILQPAYNAVPLGIQLKS